jgi:hypothetical protein
MSHRLLPAVIAGLAIITAACSSGGTHHTAQGAATAASASDSTGPSSGSSDKKEPAERLTPLSAFFTTGSNGQPSDADREAAANDFGRQEQILADCMREQGFEYIPRDYNQSIDAKVKNAEAYDLPPDQYAERWGYGISTIDASQFEAEVPDDPNSAILSTLSPAARSAYDKAMLGFDTSTEGGLMSLNPDGSFSARPIGSTLDSKVPDGCSSRAMRAVYGEDFDRPNKAASAEFDGLNEEMGALWDRVVNDPRVSNAKKGWGDCMADAGHPEATDPDNGAQLVITRFSALYGVDADHFKEVRAGMKGATHQPDPAALAELQNYERSLAVADRRCKTPYDDAVFTVQTDVENRFIDEHRAELERYRDSLSLQGGNGRAARARIAGVLGGPGRTSGGKG